MGQRVNLLDHGYLEQIEVWGSDEAIIRSARMSTDKGFLGWGPKGWKCEHTGCDWKGIERPTTGQCPSCFDYGSIYAVPGDEKLLRFLWEKKHSTPFEFAGLTVEAQAPLIVFREWHRHRVPFGYSELSARYTPMPDENYVPTVERIVSGSKATGNKQAMSSSGVVIDDASAIEWLEELIALYDHAQRVYESGLARGVPKELARLPVPVGRYSRHRATGNLRGWLAFLTLRTAPDAQWEIRQYSNAVATMLREKFPRTMEIFEGPR